MNTPNALRILIVDDEPEFVELLRNELLEVTADVHTAPNGALGLEAARTLQPHIIISDYNMPELNGLELLRSLKDENHGATVIWTTGYANETLRKQAWKLGVYEVFEKPFRATDLIQCVLAISQWTSEAKAPAVDLTTIGSRLATRTLSLTFDVQVYNQLLAYARTQHVSPSSLITQWIQDLVDADPAPQDAPKPRKAS